MCYLLLCCTPYLYLRHSTLKIFQNLLGPTSILKTMTQLLLSVRMLHFLYICYIFFVTA